MSCSPYFSASFPHATTSNVDVGTHFYNSLATSHTCTGVPNNIDSVQRSVFSERRRLDPKANALRLKDISLVSLNVRNRW